MCRYETGWRVCCARIEAVDADRCFCDGAVAAALDISARSVIHARIMAGAVTRVNAVYPKLESACFSNL